MWCHNALQGSYGPVWVVLTDLSKVRGLVWRPHTCCPVRRTDTPLVGCAGTLTSYESRSLGVTHPCLAVTHTPQTSLRAQVLRVTYEGHNCPGGPGKPYRPSMPCADVQGTVR
jgi:hypothetical protein